MTVPFQTTTLLRTRGLDKQSARLLRRFVRLMDGVNADPAAVGAVISFESGWDPKARNPHSNAVGLIQWTKSGAAAQGLDRETIARMTAEEQLELVADWYGQHDKSNWLYRDYYLAVFAPAGIRKPLSHVLYSFGTPEYDQNAAMDADGDGLITVQDVSVKFDGSIAEASKRPPLVVVDRGYWGAAALAAALTGGALLAKRYGWL